MTADEQKVKVVVLKSFFVRDKVKSVGATIEVTEAQAKNFEWTGQAARAGSKAAKALQKKQKAADKKDGDKDSGED